MTIIHHELQRVAQRRAGEARIAAAFNAAQLSAARKDAQDRPRKRAGILHDGMEGPPRGVFIVFLPQLGRGLRAPALSAKFSRRLSIARRAQSLRIKPKPAKHMADPFHLECRSYAVGFNANRHRRGQTQNAGILFQRAS